MELRAVRGLRRMHEINDTLSGITGARSDELQLAREVLTLSNRNLVVSLWKYSLCKIEH